MSSWIVFLILNLLSGLACWQFVPADHRQNYALCRRDWFCLAARLSVHLIWIVAAVQWWLLPTSFPIWVRVVGAGLIITGKALVIWSRRVNSLFVPALIYVPPHLRVTPMMIYCALITYRAALETIVLDHADS
jgi:hypothetical protein